MITVKIKLACQVLKRITILLNLMNLQNHDH